MSRSILIALRLSTDFLCTYTINYLYLFVNWCNCISKMQQCPNNLQQGYT